MTILRAQPIRTSRIEIYEMIQQTPDPGEQIKAADSDTRPRDPPRPLSVQLVCRVPSATDDGRRDKACEIVGKSNSAFIPIHRYTATKIIGLEHGCNVLSRIAPHSRLYFLLLYQNTYVATSHLSLRDEPPQSADPGLA